MNSDEWVTMWWVEMGQELITAIFTHYEFPKNKWTYSSVKKKKKKNSNNNYIVHGE